VGKLEGKKRLGLQQMIDNIKMDDRDIGIGTQGTSGGFL
jgi:hypothetical protein